MIFAYIVSAQIQNLNNLPLGPSQLGVGFAPYQRDKIGI